MKEVKDNGSLMTLEITLLRSHISKVRIQKANDSRASLGEEKTDLGIFIISRNSDKKIMQRLRIMNGANSSRFDKYLTK